MIAERPHDKLDFLEMSEMTYKALRQKSKGFIVWVKG